MDFISCFSFILTTGLLITTMGVLLRKSQFFFNLWLCFRFLYFSAGVILSGIYIAYVNNSTTSRKGYKIDPFVYLPLMFSLASWLLSCLIGRTRPPTPATKNAEADPGAPDPIVNPYGQATIY